MRGQMSAEMLILIVVILAIVALVASQLTKTAEKTGASLENQSDIMNKRAQDAVKAKRGEFCSEDNQCLPGPCDKINYKCQ